MNFLEKDTVEPDTLKTSLMDLMTGFGVGNAMAIVAGIIAINALIIGTYFRNLNNDNSIAGNDLHNTNKSKQLSLFIVISIL